jgi:hypothetical protein
MGVGVIRARGVAQAIVAQAVYGTPPIAGVT